MPGDMVSWWSNQGSCNLFIWNTRRRWRPIVVLQAPSVKLQASLTRALGDDRMNLEREEKMEEKQLKRIADILEEILKLVKKDMGVKWLNLLTWKKVIRFYTAIWAHNPRCLVTSWSHLSRAGAWRAQSWSMLKDLKLDSLMRWAPSIAARSWKFLEMTIGCQLQTSPHESHVR